MDDVETILSLSEAELLAEKKMWRKILLAVRDGAFNEDQVKIWAEEIVTGLSPYLGIESYDDGLDIHDQIAAVISGSIRERVCEAITEAR